MAIALRIFYAFLAFTFTAATCVIAFFAIYSLLKAAPTGSPVAVDFNAILTVLLTTVSVIFTVCAILLAVLGIFGFRNLKRDAGKFAEAQALSEIAKAFGPSGRGTSRIEQELSKEDGHHRKFVEQRIRTEIIALLPVIANLLNDEAKRLSFDDPTDEGDID